MYTTRPTLSQFLEGYEVWKVQQRRAADLGAPKFLKGRSGNHPTQVNGFARFEGGKKERYLFGFPGREIDWNKIPYKTLFSGIGILPANMEIPFLT